MFQKYFESGYTLIPLKSKDKNPIINDWTKYCREQATEKMIELWDQQFIKSKLNVGIPCGKSNGIIGLDIDTSDPEIVKLFPKSPVARRGRSDREGVRFFKYNENIKSQNFPYGEILSDGRQSVLPPSIHPITGEAYSWVTPDTLLDYKASELPELDLAFLTKLLPKAKKDVNIKTGRNSHFVKMITSMRGRGESESKIIDEIYKYDLEFNKPRLFTDKSENYPAKNEAEARKNAWIMVNNVTKSLIQSGVATIINDNTAIQITEEQEQKLIAESFKFVPYPKARGMMAEFQQVCSIRSTSDNQDGLSLGASLALMAAITSNKYATEVNGMITCPNVYIMNIAYSSFGKGLSQDVLTSLLQDSNLLGSSNYKSDTSMLSGISEQQERLIVNDESSAFLRNIGGKESYNGSIVELMCELFSKSSSKFGGVASATNGSKFGACWNPHLSYIGSTTPNGFRNSVNRDIAAKGLLPRFVIFQQMETGKWNGRKDRSMGPSLQQSLQAKVNKFLKLEKIIHPDFEPFIDLKSKSGESIQANLEGMRYQPRIVKLTEEALELWYQNDEALFNEKSKNPEGFESAFIGRFAEIALKFALSDTLSLERSKIEADSIQWAFDVLNSCWHNSKNVYELAHAENRDDAELIKILNTIKDRGLIAHHELLKKSKLKVRQMTEIISTLLDSGQIEVIEKTQDGSGRKSKYYKTI